jgi:hypothetical protein
LIWGIFDLLGQAGLEVAFDSMGLVVDDLHRGIILLDGFEVRYAEIVGKRICGIAVFWTWAYWLETFFIQFSEVLTQHLALYLLESALLVLEGNTLDPQD